MPGGWAAGEVDRVPLIAKLLWVLLGAAGALVVGSVVLLGVRRVAR
jgi:hypothetical protein